jgi:alpha-beta hydrolase superfamily lysophospholipase
MAKRRLMLTIVVVLGVLVSVGGNAIGRIASPPDIPAFYDPPSPLPPGKPGEIIRTESIHSEFPGARLWRILYHSTDLEGTDVAVSALLAAPTAATPTTGYPLVAVGHGTVGINRGCAPSIDPYDAFRESPSAYDLFVRNFVEAGYAVVMSDYQGLGAPGDNSYLIGEVEGRNVLDSARAALTFPELTLDRRLLIWGQSQGGHAALFAGQLASTYAPDLVILGVAAEAPAADLAAIFRDLTVLNDRGGIVALPLMAADAWTKAYPDLNLDQLLTNRGTRALNNVVKNVCLIFAILATQLAKPSDLLQPDALQVLGPYTDKNIPQVSPYAMPLFIAQGDADSVIPVSTNTHFAERLCAGGNRLIYRIYEGAGHLSVVDAASADVLAWMQHLRDGVIPAPACPA